MLLQVVLLCGAVMRRSKKHRRRKEGLEKQFSVYLGTPTKLHVTLTNWPIRHTVVEILLLYC